MSGIHKKSCNCRECQLERYRSMPSGPMYGHEVFRSMLPEYGVPDKPMTVTEALQRQADTGSPFTRFDDECPCLQCQSDRMSAVRAGAVPGHPLLEEGLTKLSEYARGAKDMLNDKPVPADRIGDAKARKATPLATGVIDYFPDALLAVAELSRIGNDQHNPGQPLHWDRSKSGDESDALMRHFVDRGTIDVDKVRHSTKVAWRALALLQKEIENAGK